MNLASILTDSAARHGAHVAIKLDDIELTYAQLDGATAHLAGLLHAKGFSPGDRVGIMLPNVPPFAICYYGVLRAGGSVVPMNVLLKAREVEYYLGDSEAKLMFGWEALAQDAIPGADRAGAECVVVAPEEFMRIVGAAQSQPDLVDTADDDTAVILYTSGTTGTPKGAELTHSNLRRNCQIADGLFDLGPGTVVLGALPLFHSFGQTCALNATIAGGGTLTLIPRFDPVKALEIVARDRVTVFEGVPTMYGALLHAPGRERFDTSTLAICVSGGAALPVELLRAFDKEFDCKVLEGYGLSETSPIAAFNHPDRERKPGSIGTPVDGVEMKVVDENDRELPRGEPGEIVIRGHNVMKRYWKRPQATAEVMRGGWFHTGDIAIIDENGYFFIVDRKKDMIVRGGYNVYPREVEEVLYEHPAVREAAVIGVADEEYGEEVGAAVALKDGADASAEELREYVRSRIAAYKYPRHVWFVGELPKGPTGKVLKREIEPPDLA